MHAESQAHCELSALMKATSDLLIWLTLGCLQLAAARSAAWLQLSMTNASIHHTLLHQVHPPLVSQMLSDNQQAAASQCVIV